MLPSRHRRRPRPTRTRQLLQLILCPSSRRRGPLGPRPGRRRAAASPDTATDDLVISAAAAAAAAAAARPRVRLTVRPGVASTLPAGGH